MQQHESAVSTHISSLLNLLPPPFHPLDHHRAPNWAPVLYSKQIAGAKLFDSLMEYSALWSPKWQMDVITSSQYVTSISRRWLLQLPVSKTGEKRGVPEAPGKCTNFGCSHSLVGIGYTAKHAMRSGAVQLGGLVPAQTWIKVCDLLIKRKKKEWSAGFNWWHLLQYQ